MSDYRVFLKTSGENVEIEIPDIYKDPDSETYTDQIKTYLCKEKNIDFDSIKVDVKRNKRILKNCQNIEIMNDDEVYFLIDHSLLEKFQGVSMKTGYNSVKQKSIINFDPLLIQNHLDSIFNNYQNQINDIKITISTFCESLEKSIFKDKIYEFFIFNDVENLFNQFQMTIISNCYYFCPFHNGRPRGVGFMFDSRNKIYREGNFIDNRIIQGKMLKLGAIRVYSEAQCYLDGNEYNIGTIHYFDIKETYTGFLHNGQYYASGTLEDQDGIYIGRFIECKRSGYGIMRYKNGDYYYGFWSNGKKNTYGKHKYCNGDYYTGVYIDGLENEHGIYYDRKSNITYSGTFCNGKPTYNKHEFKLFSGHIFYGDFFGKYEVKMKNIVIEDQTMEILNHVVNHLNDSDDEIMDCDDEIRENIENRENREITENIENIENIENRENTENTENRENHRKRKFSKFSGDDQLYSKYSLKKIFDGVNLYYRSDHNDYVKHSHINTVQCYYGHFNFEGNIYGSGRIFYNDSKEICSKDVIFEEHSGAYIKTLFSGYREYQCTFNNSSVNGFGLIKYSNGDVYIGEIKNGRKNGKGLIKRKNGESEYCCWIHDMKQVVKTY